MARAARGRTLGALVGFAGEREWRAARRPDQLLVEEPLTIRFGDPGTTVATTMRTPGNDFELAVGWCHGEGLLEGATVTDVRYCAQSTADESGYNEVTVLAGGKQTTASAARVGTVTSSCGWCGTVAVDGLAARLEPLPVATLPRLEVVAAVPERVRPHQELFAATGAAHAAALIAPDGEVLLVREDVGRHNALDKLVGRLVLDGALPSPGHGVFVSGRASFELVAKAWAAGVSWMVAVSAPTQLAVDTARRAGLALCGFARRASLNVYAPDRWPAGEAPS